jgi:protein TonB
MVRAYSLYFDVPAADWERRRKSIVLALVVVAHLALLAWFLRAYPPAPRNATSLVMVLLNDSLSPSLKQVGPGPAKGNSTADKPASTRHTDTTRAADRMHTPVTEGVLIAGASAATSAQEYGAASSAAGGSLAAGRFGTRANPVVYIPPRVLHHWRPPYPRDAYDGHVQGEAQILVTVSADGTLKDARVQTSSGSEELDQASLEAVRHYAFGAATKDHVAVEAQAIVVMEWSIRPSLELKIASGMTKQP